MQSLTTKINEAIAKVPWFETAYKEEQAQQQKIPLQRLFFDQKAYEDPVKYILEIYVYLQKSILKSTNLKELPDAIEYIKEILGLIQ